MGRYLSAIAALATIACSAPMPLTNPSPDVIRITGAVHYYALEGGFWAIGGVDGTTYDPVGALPSDFQVEGLRVRLEARLRPDLVSFHMAGPIVEIIRIERL